LHGENEREVPVIVIQIETSINTVNKVKIYMKREILAQTVA